MIAWVRRWWGWVAAIAAALGLAAIRAKLGRPGGANTAHRDALRDAALRGVAKAQADAAREADARARGRRFEEERTRLNHQLEVDLSKPEPTDADVAELRHRLDVLRLPKS